MTRTTSTTNTVQKFAVVGAFEVVDQDHRISVSRFVEHGKHVIAVAVEERTLKGWRFINDLAVEMRFDTLNHVSDAAQFRAMDAFHRELNGMGVRIATEKFIAPR